MYIVTGNKAYELKNIHARSHRICKQVIMRNLTESHGKVYYFHIYTHPKSPLGPVHTVKTKPMLSLVKLVGL